jgi:hypothetical protein
MAVLIPLLNGKDTRLPPLPLEVFLGGFLKPGWRPCRLCIMILNEPFHSERRPCQLKQFLAIILGRLVIELVVGSICHGFIDVYLAATAIHESLDGLREVFEQIKEARQPFEEEAKLLLLNKFTNKGQWRGKIKRRRHTGMHEDFFRINNSASVRAGAQWPKFYTSANQSLLLMRILCTVFHEHKNPYERFKNLIGELEQPLFIGEVAGGDIECLVASWVLKQQEFLDAARMKLHVMIHVLESVHVTYRAPGRTPYQIFLLVTPDMDQDECLRTQRLQELIFASFLEAAINL